jgi:cytochrome c oxidase subunit 4
MSAAGHPQTISARWLFATWGALVALAALSLVMSFAHLGAAGIPVALAIAAAKAVLVALIFMELLVEKPAFRIVLGVVVFFFVLLIGLVWADVDTRTIAPLAPPTG